MPRDRVDCVKEAFDLAALPYLSQARRYSSSSYDRSGGNRDCDQYLYIDGPSGARVLLDALGPGCVYRMFFPGCGRPDMIMRIYIDGNPAPAIEGTLGELFCGSHPSFPAPLAEIGALKPNPLGEQSAFLCYVPIPFQHKILIVVDSPAPMLHYNIDYVIYSQDVKVNSYRPDQDNSALIEALLHATTTGDLYERGEIALEPGSIVHLCVVQSAYSQICALRLRLEGLRLNAPREADSLLRGVRLMARFDGEAAPSIDASLSGIFAFPLHEADPKGAPYRPLAYPVGLEEDNWLYLRFPMPFEDSAELSLAVPENIRPGRLEYEVYTQPIDSSSRFGRLNIRQITYEAKADHKDEIRLLSTDGFGKLVGVTRSIETNLPASGNAIPRGYERIYIDGSRSPQINGTGTRDFFYGANNRLGGAFSWPLYGGGYHSKWSGDAEPHEEDVPHKSVAYRFFVGDAIPFGRCLKFDIEHGIVNDCYEKGEVTLFYYLNPHNVLVESDIVEVSEGKGGHGLRVECACMESLCRSQYEGACSSSVVSEFGALLYQGGYMTFALKLHTNCTGALIRRRFEYAFQNQSANIWVNGEYAGVWYDAGCNPVMRLRESEFHLPEKAVRGKRMIEVRVEATSPVWSLCSCRIDCFITPPRHGASAVSGNRRRYSGIFEQLQALLGDHLTEKVNVEKLAASLCVSASHLRRVVRSNTGYSFTEYVNRQKIDYAKFLLMETDYTASNIAKLLKFSDAGYFFRLFKQYMGETCSAYRASHKSPTYP